jgi:hypothetical protein
VTASEIALPALAVVALLVVLVLARRGKLKVKFKVLGAEVNVSADAPMPAPAPGRPAIEQSCVGRERDDRRVVTGRRCVRRMLVRVRNRYDGQSHWWDTLTCRLITTVRARSVVTWTAVCVAMLVAGCQTTSERPPGVIWVRDGSVDDVFADNVVASKRYRAHFIGSTQEDDVMFFATRVRDPRGFVSGVTWSDGDVVAFAGSGQERRLGQSTYREFVFQGGLDANDRVRRAAARLRPQWGPRP